MIHANTMGMLVMWTLRDLQRGLVLATSNDVASSSRRQAARRSPPCLAGVPTGPMRSARALVTQQQVLAGFRCSLGETAMDGIVVILSLLCVVIPIGFALLLQLFPPGEQGGPRPRGGAYDPWGDDPGDFPGNVPPW